MQFFQESGGMSAIHLHVVELEGNGQSCPQPTLAVALPMHQHSSMLNFIPRLWLTLQSLVTSKVFVSVTIGIGDFIHSSNAIARFVSLGLISCFIFLFNHEATWIEITVETAIGGGELQHAVVRVGNTTGIVLLVAIVPDHLFRGGVCQYLHRTP